MGPDGCSSKLFFPEHNLFTVEAAEYKKIWLRQSRNRSLQNSSGDKEKYTVSMALALLQKSELERCVVLGSGRNK